jgi:hypothetical protein
MSEQLSLDFEGAPAAISGLEIWREQRRAEIEALAGRSGLPIGQRVRVWLTSGVLVEGKLLLASDELFINQRRSTDLRLQIGPVDFRVADVESCVRLD